MIYLSQRDLEWSSDKLGSSTLTVGRFGCTTSCVSMVSDDFGCYKSPLELAHNANNYTKDGLILWKNLDTTFKNQMCFVFRGYGSTGFEQALNNPVQRVILQVNDHAHWVKLIRQSGSDWIAIDPWDGKECKVFAKYKNITGYAIFEDIAKTQLENVAVDKALAKSLSGKLLICPEHHGRLYYIDLEAKLHPLGTNAEEVQNTIAKLSLGVSAEVIARLPWA